MNHKESSNSKYLIVDQGNTLIKFYTFKDNEINWSVNFNTLDKSAINALNDEIKDVTNGIISSVSVNPEVIIGSLPNIKWIVLTDETPVPVINNYKSPETLGKDRLAGIVAGGALFPGRNVLVIDAGTAITYDILTSENEYSGGSISPGISIRYRALNTFTGRLPLLEVDDTKQLTGTDTTESIRTGVMNGALFEIEGFINAYSKIYPDLVTVITGGDRIYFDKKLKSNIFVSPNLVAYGLKLILEYNLEK